MSEWSALPGARYFHPMSYAKRAIWSGDEPSPTIRATIRGIPDAYKPHPRDAIRWGACGEVAKGLSIGEAATLQGYPGGFQWSKPVGAARLQVGNAVPPPVARKVLEELLSKEATVNDFTQHAVLDLFAGTGVGVACQQLGVTEHGVEKMKAAQETRKLNGMGLAYDDVWDIDKAQGLHFDTLWASPPCQTFSVAGKGDGRKALDQVLQAIDDNRWTSIESLRALGDEVGDERTALVLTPLAYINRFHPTYVAFEQVPAVLPVWEACATVMRSMGYSVWVGFLHAEQYGVPQTRKRAYLIARLDGKDAQPPTPTHSRYYSRTPERLDLGVRKWVSMAEGLADE